ncbi:hypothetical protein JB92DRAFT_3113496 [Gautieria morchelliformis]|nr:hypothetical protein JB92DRAFT_3113496 [Gautieria morchelliformis]
MAHVLSELGIPRSPSAPPAAELISREASLSVSPPLPLRLIPETGATTGVPSSASSKTARLDTALLAGRARWARGFVSRVSFRCVVIFHMLLLVVFSPRWPDPRFRAAFRAPSPPPPPYSPPILSHHPPINSTNTPSPSPLPAAAARSHNQHAGFLGFVPAQYKLGDANSYAGPH